MSKEQINIRDCSYEDLSKFTKKDLMQEISRLRAAESLAIWYRNISIAMGEVQRESAQRATDFSIAMIKGEL